MSYVVYVYIYIVHIIVYIYIYLCSCSYVYIFDNNVFKQEHEFVAELTHAVESVNELANEVLFSILC